MVQSWASGQSEASVKSGRRHSVQMSLACVLSLDIFWVLLQSLELCLVLGIGGYLVLCP